MSKDEVNLEYDAILIDTSIFDNYGLRLETGLLGKLKQFKNGPAELVLPDIIINEVRSHLESKIKISRNALEKSINDAKDHLFFSGSALETAKEVLINSAEIVNLASTRLDSFINESGATVLVSDDFVSVASLVDMYFSNKPPFSESGKKKSEFPDAIALKAVEEWAEEEGKSVIAISQDKDWEAFCEQSDRVDYELDLSQGLALFHDANASFALRELLSSSIPKGEAIDFIREIESSLESSLCDITPDQDADSSFYWEPEGCSAKYKSFKFITNDHEKVKFRIIDVDEDWIVLETRVMITVEAEGHFSLSVHDSIDRDYVSMGGVSIEKDAEFETELLITISGQLDGSLDDFSIDEVEVVDVISYIDFGELQLDW